MTNNNHEDAKPPESRLLRVLGKCGQVTTAVKEEYTQIGDHYGGKKGSVLMWILVLILVAIVIVMFLPVIFKILGWNLEP